MRGLAHTLIEVRQDLISDTAGQEEWAERLARALNPILRDPAMSRVEHFGSRVGPGHHSSPLLPT
jgi:predicted N-formylglutamate amidohydrolase